MFSLQVDITLECIKIHKYYAMEPEKWLNGYSSYYIRV